MVKETVEKQPALVKAIRSAYGDAIQVIKAGQDEEFFKSKAKELFNLDAGRDRCRAETEQSQFCR